MDSFMVVRSIQSLDVIGPIHHYLKHRWSELYPKDIIDFVLSF